MVFKMGGVSYAEASTPRGMRIYAVGDIHGRFDLFIDMHRRIMSEIQQDRPDDWRLIYLGDYIDRGPDSCQVLEFLRRSVEADPRIIALAGNHDKGMLDFLVSANPEGIFALHGGDTTARSYGVDLDISTPEALQEGHARLLKAIPQSHVKFLTELPLSAVFGDLFFCHAGIRPGVALKKQRPEDLLWIRQAFRSHIGLHPKLIVHGHTPGSIPELLPNRINLDTGAFKNGVLSAMRFDGVEKMLIQVSDAEQATP